MRSLVLAILALALSGCASQHQQDGIADAAKTPFTDLNLSKSTIPPVLIEAKKQPYFPPPLLTCEGLFADIGALDNVLEPDLDAPPVLSTAGPMERGATALGDAAVGAIQKTVEGAVPFRGWVRKLSGAERHAKDVAAAIAAGTVRRGFLKGVALSRGCPNYYTVVK